MTTVVRLTVPNGEGVHGITPAVVRQVDGFKWRAVFRKEDELVTDLPSGNHALSKRELPSQHLERARTKIDFAILTGLGSILLLRQDDGLRDTDLAGCKVAVADLQRKLLGLAQSCEEAELIIVAVPFAVDAVARSNDRLGFLDRKRIDLRSIFLSDSKRL